MEEEMTRRPFTGLPEDMYARYDDQDQNNRDFIVAAYDNNIISELFWPNYEAAPWHLQMEVGNQIINFWPHKAKAHVAYESSVAYGLPAMFATVRRVQGETFDDFDLVEREQ
jgi:hypothetical protein